MSSLHISVCFFLNNSMGHFVGPDVLTIDRSCLKHNICLEIKPNLPLNNVCMAMPIWMGFLNWVHRCTTPQLSSLVLLKVPGTLPMNPPSSITFMFPIYIFLSKWQLKELLELLYHLSHDFNSWLPPSTHCLFHISKGKVLFWSNFIKILFVSKL